MASAVLVTIAVVGVIGVCVVRVGAVVVIVGSCRVGDTVIVASLLWFWRWH